MCSAFNISKCTHTAVNTHTHTHTPCTHTAGAVGRHLCCDARGAVGDSVSCSRAPQSWHWRWRERCTFTLPTYNSCQPETQTHNLSITSPTLLPLSHDFPIINQLYHNKTLFVSKWSVKMVFAFQKMLIIFIPVMKSWIFSIITPVFSVTWSFRNHTNMLICCSRNISDYYQHWKKLTSLLFILFIIGLSFFMLVQFHVR